MTNYSYYSQSHVYLQRDQEEDPRRFLIVHFGVILLNFVKKIVSIITFHARNNYIFLQIRIYYIILVYLDRVCVQNFVINVNTNAL